MTHTLETALWNSVGRGFFAALPLLLAAYALTLVAVGPCRAAALWARAYGWTASLMARLARYICRVLLKMTVNAATLTARLAVSLGQPDKVTEAWARFLERTADAVL